jgi:hypothetical protein
VTIVQHRFPWAVVVRIAGRTKDVTLSVRWPGAQHFHVRAFGLLSARRTETLTNLGVTFHYDDWMVTGHGIMVSCYPPDGYRLFPELPRE